MALFLKSPQPSEEVEPFKVQGRKAEEPALESGLFNIRPSTLLVAASRGFVPDSRKV
jgi:hypothetical protein